jgi:predicted nucleic acid-binding protein
VVYQELLQGCRDDRNFRRLRAYLDTQPFYDVLAGRESYIRAARLFFDLRRKGRPVRSTGDCLIAQIAIENGLRLLHDDADFNAIQAGSKLRTYP